MQAYRLIPHPAHPSESVTAIEARIGDDDPNWLLLRWRVEDAGALILPAIGSKSRADGLWQTTCFELFLRPDGGEEYHEWNLSPSRQWNAYRFTGYREGMEGLSVARAPDCMMRPGSKFAIFDAAIPRAALPMGPCVVGLSAVIEEQGGAKSYWALAHPQGKPDFHDSACFAATLDPRNTA
ncbi:DOMON-like domain-containing protein [Altererythrobacter sp.]|uniref:DOMON-like domain-containing protein n=1 Tax=Altererythrobacter sp. TaxID=1872480 RepID=UPI003D042A9A